MMWKSCAFVCLLMLVAALLLPAPASGQTGTIAGTVTDSTGQTLPGVNVLVEGTQLGSATGPEGTYSISGIEPGTYTVRASFIGYTDAAREGVEVTAGETITVDFVMRSQATQLEDVVVVGYGKTREANLTSAVSKVSADELVQGAATDPAQLLRGKVPGLTINKTGSNPAAGAELKLRGVGTLNGDSSPLVIVDGVEGSLSEVSTRDIESVSVLKGASASAIYGTRGSNGVVVVETKRVDAEGVRVNVESYTSVQQMTQEIPVLSAEAFRERAVDDLQGATDYGGNTDWSEEVMRDMPISTVNNLQVSYGSAQTDFIANLNYEQSEGLVRRSNNNEVSGRFRINHSMFDGKLSATANLLASKGWRYDGNEGGGSFSGLILRDVVAFNPTRPVRNEDGSYNENVAFKNSENPVSLVQETNGTYDETRVKLFGSVEYTPVPGLNVEVQASHLTDEGFEGYAETKQHVLSIQDGLNGYASRRTDQSEETILELTADYSGSFLENHNYEILGGYTWKENYFESFFANNYDFPTDAVGYNNLSDGRAASRGQAFQDSYKERTNLIGYFARLNYNFANRYLLTASFRREGSSKFGANNKWGEFPGLSLGWRIAQEPFMESVGFLDNLKLRFGFGVTGTAPTGAYPSLAPLTFGNNVLWNGQWVSTVQPSSNPNPDLKWEEKTEYNLGLDFAVLNNRISGSIDIYRRQTDDLIYPFTVPSPPFLYDTLLDNAGMIQNDGLEVALSAFPVQGNNFQWSSTATYSTNRNELVSLSNERFSLGNGYFDTGHTGAPIQQSTHRVQIGEEIGNFYGYKSIGVTEDEHWLIEGENGEPKSILDQAPDDKKVIGNGVPDHNLSWTNTVRYGNWDLNVTMRGAFGFQILNLRRMYYEVPVQARVGNVLEGAFDAPYGDQPLSVDQSKQYVSYFVEDGDFWKIDNVTLGYQFGLGQEGTLKKARIYAAADNFLTITGYSGFDPDINFSGLTPGYDNRNRFPSSKNFTLGVSLTL